MPLPPTSRSPFSTGSNPSTTASSAPIHSHPTCGAPGHLTIPPRNGSNTPGTSPSALTAPALCSGAINQPAPTKAWRHRVQRLLVPHHVAGELNAAELAEGAPVEIDAAVVVDE